MTASEPEAPGRERPVLPCATDGEGRDTQASAHSALTHRPSVHARAALTWCAIFPLVLLGMTVLANFDAYWPPVLRALVLTLVVVPAAVYALVPGLTAVHVRVVVAWARRRSMAAPRPRLQEETEI